MNKQLPPLKTLPAFLAVAKQLSFSKAADSLYVTHSAVSQQIKILETFLQVKLFTRDNNQVALTAAGKEYMLAIESGLDLIQGGTQRIKKLNSPILSVNVSTTFAMYWLIARMGDFQKQQPDIDLRITTLSHDTKQLEHTMDCMVSYGKNKDWEQYHKTKLCHDSLVLVAKTKQKLVKLFKQNKAIYVKMPMRKEDWKQWCQKANMKEPKKEKRLYFQN